AGKALCCPYRQRSLDAVDIGRGREPGGEEFLKALEVPADDLEDEVDLAIEHVALAHLWEGAHVLLELPQRFLGLALQAHQREYRDVEAELGRIDICVVAANHSRLLERADTAKARWCGEADA